jgi:hypothetical protein
MTEIFSNRKKISQLVHLFGKKIFSFFKQKIAKNGLRPCTSKPGAESRSVDTDR